MHAIYIHRADRSFLGRTFSSSIRSSPVPLLVNIQVTLPIFEFTNPFTAYPAKNFPGMKPSTFLSRVFGDQGVKLKTRKEQRPM